MKTSLLLLALLPAAAQAGDVSVFYGKGVKHNPDADALAVYARTPTASPYVFNEYGVASINTSLDKEFGRAFVMASAAKQLEFTKGIFYANVSLGAALCSRTADSVELAVAPYGSAFVGIRYKGVSVGLGEMVVHRPNLSYPWEAGHGAAYHEAGERWNSPVFSGIRIGVELK